ncbi:MAG: S-layer homology domain-containing protein [Kiritimatiellales bacterium]|nr:S-layer homology domain-containing protein [Kiritimatiellales bacterium]
MKNLLFGIGVGLVISPLVAFSSNWLFYDVDPSEWYGLATQRLQNYGIITGYSDGNFRPNQKVSRAELAVTLDRILSKLDSDYTSAIPSPEFVAVKLYFGDEQIMIDRDCGATRMVTRTIPKTATIADATLRELFKGPTQQERNDGLTSSFDNETGYFGQGIKPLVEYYEGIRIQNGVATVKFSRKALEYLNNTACTQDAVQSPIEDTLKQFSTIDMVQYAIDGEVFDLWDA